MPHMEGIFINGEKAKFHPEDILDTDASQYTEEIGESVTAYLTEHITNPPIDTSLSIAGAAADAKKTGDEISELKEDLTHAFPHDTVSGAVASFTDGADDVPMDSVIVNIEPVQSGSGDPSPTNVRPISGWSEVNVHRTGKNLFPYKDIESQTKNGVTITVEKSDGIITNIHLQGTATTAFSIPFYINGEDEPWVLPKGEFKLYIGGDKPTQFHTFDINVRKIGTTSDISANTGATTITLSEQTVFGSAYIWIYSGTVLNHNIVPVIVRSETDTSVKYPITQRQSINISLGQTVYGGTLDVTNGVLTVDRAMVDLGTLNWSYSASNTVFSVSFAVGAADGKCICTIYRNRTTVSASNDKSIMIGKTGWYVGNLTVRDSDYTDATAFKAAVTGQTLVYELATPITVQLTPHEVRSLLGDNNVWADSGDSEVTYRADPTLYIQRLTEPDADMVADSNITSGSYFMVGNTLYKATANIASGGAITPSVNCTRKSLAEALNEINA